MSNAEMIAMLSGFILLLGGLERVFDWMEEIMSWIEKAHVRYVQWILWRRIRPKVGDYWSDGEFNYNAHARAMAWWRGRSPRRMHRLGL